MLSILLFSVPILSHYIFKNIENTQTFSNKIIGEKNRVIRCIFCKKYCPVTKCNCGAFTALKNNITKVSYNAKILKTCDENGYCAAGILVYFVEPDDNIKILMLEEIRENKIAFNLPGGKREICEENGKFKIEDSIETAIFEFIEELPQFEYLLKNYKISTVYWNCQAKYVLYPIRIFTDIKNIQKNFINLKDIDIENIHPFSKRMLEEVILPLN